MKVLSLTSTSGYLWVCLALFASLVRANCFLPNGTDRNVLWGTPNAYIPCLDADKTSDGHSMCCRVNSPNGDVCTKDGLCYNEGGNITWRESCTDPTWKSPNCLQLCNGDDIGPGGVAYVDTETVVTTCADGSICCGDKKVSSVCCDNGKGVWIINRTVVTTKPESTSLSSSSSPTLDPSLVSTSIPASPTGSTSPTNTSGISSKRNSISTPTVVGVVIGCVAAVGLVGVALWFFRRHRRQTQSPYYVTASYPKDQRGELDASVNPKELHEVSSPLELDGNPFMKHQHMHQQQENMYQ